MQREQTEIPSEGVGGSVAEQSRSGRQAVDVTDARPPTAAPSGADRGSPEPNGGARMLSGGPTCVQGASLQPTGPAVSQQSRAPYYKIAFGYPTPFAYESCCRQEERTETVTRMAWRVRKGVAGSRADRTYMPMYVREDERRKPYVV